MNLFKFIVAGFKEKQSNFGIHMKHTPIDILFLEEKTKPVCFFYKLPQNIRDKYTVWYREMFSDSDLMWIQEKKWIEPYMHDISPERFEWITKYADDVDYFTFYDYFELLQPAIETIINGNDLYEKYPEYLI
jgi:hypothetical protein